MQAIGFGLTAMMRDLSEAMRLRRLWFYLARREIASGFERTVLGFLWVPMTTLLHILIIGPVMALVFSSGKSYFAYFALSYAVWKGGAIQTLGEASTMWVRSEKYLRQMPIPSSFFILKSVAKQVMRLAMSIPIGIAFAAADQGGLPATSPIALVGFVAVCANLPWIVTLLGLICVRFRDVASFIPTATFMIYLLTPIIWRIERLEEHRWVAEVNPLYHMMELVRAPLLGEPPAAMSWAIVLGLAAAGNGVGLLAMSVFRRRIPLWL